MPTPPAQPELSGMDQVFNLTSGGAAPVTTAKTKKPKPATPDDLPSLPPNLGKAIRLPVVDFNDPNRPLTCLEVDFPIAPINALARVEASSGAARSPIYQMSKWWARRPASVFRGILIAAGLKAPDDHEQAARYAWENFYVNHHRAGNFKRLRVLDPFMGGGTTLVEGARLGYDLTGNDLNPVAWFVVRNELAFSDPEQVRASFDEIEREVKPLIHPFHVTNCPGGHQGQWLDKRTGRPADVDPVDLEPGQRKHYEWDGAEVIYTFWAKHGPCTAEACNHRTPVFKNPVIAEKDLVTEYFELRCLKTGATYHAELGETRLAPGCERVVLDAAVHFKESTQEFARLFKDYSKGNATEKRHRIQRLLELVDDEPALRHPDTGEWCGAAIKATLERHQRASRAADLKKKDFNIQSKPVFMYLLLDPKWFRGTPGEISGATLGGYAGADVESSARWYKERLKDLRLIEVRGRVKLPDQDDGKERFGLLPTLTLADGTTINLEQGPSDSDGSFVCARDGRSQELIESLRKTTNPAPLAIYALQCYCPKRDADGYSYGGRFFKVPDEADIGRLIQAEREWDLRSGADLSPFWPRQVIPNTRRAWQKDCLPGHGFTHWSKLFNPRQLLVHANLLKAIDSLVAKGFPDDVAEQALGAFQQYLRSQCLLAFYHRKNDQIAAALSNPNFNPKDLVVETCVFSPIGSGSWRSYVQNVLGGLKWVRSREFIGTPDNAEEPESPEVTAQVHCGSSTELGQIASESHDLVITDPPFGANLNYADLSDFFFVWLRLYFFRRLNDTDGYREAFARDFTAKAIEVIENEVEHPDDRTEEERRERAPDGTPNPRFRPPPAEHFYESSLAACWSEAFRVLKPGGLLAFTFHHDQDRAWANVLRSLFEAGFLLVATYPVIGDDTKGERAQFGSQKIEYDIVHVCRKRLEKPEPVSWAKMRRWVRDEAGRLKTLLEHSHGQSLSDADLRVILRGKALEFYSRHYGQVWIGQEILSVKNALVGINELLDDLLAEGTAAAHRPPEAADPVTRLFLRLFANRSSTPRDELHKSLKGTTVDTALLADRGWVRVVGTTVHTVPVLERFQFFTAPGRNRKIIRTDLDQAHFLTGAALPRSGLNIDAELNRETFNVKPSVDSLLDWIAHTDPNAENRQAAALAKNILSSWRAKQAAERPRRPEAAQLELLQVAQSEA
jgi:putative DNA methylase